MCGYPGSAEVILAMHRGEVDMFSGSWHVWRATQKGSFDDGSVIPVIQGGLKRTADLPNVPLMQELVDDEKTKKIIEFISAGSAIGRALITPPAVPADRLAALREAFDKLVKDRFHRGWAAVRRSADAGGTVQPTATASRPHDVIEAATRAIAAEKGKEVGLLSTYAPPADIPREALRKQAAQSAAIGDKDRSDGKSLKHYPGKGTLGLISC